MITVFKIFEENNDGTLRYSISEKEFKSHGYKLEKLYAGNYKVYTKTINRVPIWCWVAGKTIEIKDFHADTMMIVNYYLENINNEDKLSTSIMFKGPRYLSVKFNNETKEIINFLDIIEKYSHEPYKPIDMINSEYLTGGEWESIILNPTTWDDIIDELVFLTEGKIKENTNYKNWEINKSSNKFNL